MTVSASHRLMVELSMQEGEFTQGIGFANAALDTFRANLKKMAAEAKAASAQVSSAMTQTAAATKASAAAGTASAAAIKRSSTAAKQVAQDTRSSFTKVLDFADKNKVAWNQTANRIAIAGAVMVGTFTAVAVGYARFEQALDQATAVIDVSISDINSLSAAALEAGRTSQFSAVEAAQGIEALAKAGVKASEIYGGALQGSINLAAAGGISLAEAAESAAIMMIQFGKSGKDVPHIADLLAAAAGKAVGDVHDLMMALKQGGLIASQFGLSIEDTAATLALFAQNGLLGSDAGTSLKIMLLRLAAPATRAQKEMAKLGIDVWDANGAFIGMEKFAGTLQTKLGGLTDQEKDHALSVIFGTDAMRSASIMLKEGANGYAQMAEAVNDSGFALEVMRKRMDNLSGDIKRLKGAFDSLVVAAGADSNSALRGMTQNLTGLVNAVGRMNPGELNAIVQVILGLGGGSLAVAGLMKMVIGVNNFRKALSGGNGILSSFVGNTRAMTLAAGAAALALIAVSIASDAIYKNMKAAIGTTDEMAAALAGLARSKDITALEDRLQAVTHNAFKPDKSIQQDFKQYLGYVTGIGMGDFGKGFLDVGEQINRTFGNPDAVREYFRTVDEGLASLVSTGQLDTATNSFAELYDQLNLSQLSAEDVRKAFPLLYNAAVSFANGLDLQVTPSTEDYVNIMRGQMPTAVAIAIDHQNQLNKTFDRTGVAALDAATKVRESIQQMMDAFESITNPLDLRSAFEAAIDDAAKVISQKKDELGTDKELTQAAKDYRKEIRGLGTDWRKNLGSGAGRDIFSTAEGIANRGLKSLQADLPNLNAGQVQGRIKEINDALRRFAKEAGLSKEATAALIAQFELVPETIVTTFSAPGANVSKEQAQGLRDAVANLPELASVEILAPGARPSKEDVDTFMESLGEIPEDKATVIRTIAELGGVQQAQDAYDGLKDKDSWIRTQVDKSGVWWWTDYNPPDKDAWINTHTRNSTGNVKGGNLKRADGGPIPGWSPNKRADNITVAATAGEFMQPVDSVQYYGVSFMERLRRRMIPRGMVQHLADGGAVRDNKRFVQAPMRVINERNSAIDNSRGDVQFTFPGAHFGATPSEMMGAFGFAVNAGLASVGL